MYNHKKSNSLEGGKNPIETCFYLDTDFTCLWRCNLHLLNRERFSRSPGNSSSASDNLEATERITLQGRVCLWRAVGLVILQSPQTEEQRLGSAQLSGKPRDPR